MRRTKTRLLMCLFGLVATVAPILAAHAGGDGEIWLRLSPESRNVYVLAYLMGLSEGFLRGCDASSDGKAPFHLGDKPARPALEKCVDQTPKHSRISTYYAEQITAFYRENPQFRGQLIRELLEFMADGPGMTAAQIRDMLKARMKAE